MSPRSAALVLAASLAACKPDPGPAAGATSRPMQPGSMPAHPSSMPAHPASGPAAAPNQRPFTGLIKLADGVDPATVQPTDVLYLMAREPGAPGQPGRLVAVQKIAAPTFPLRYEMSAAHLMVPGMPFVGPFAVSARLDKDGDPMTKGEADLYAELAAPVMGGQEGVHLELGPKK